MPTTYNPEIIVAMADRLYSRANSIVLEMTIKYLVVGILLATGVGYAIRMRDGDTPWTGPVAAVIGALAGAAGYAAGKDKAFSLRLEAQQLLVMVEIERNTRR